MTIRPRRQSSFTHLQIIGTLSMMKNVMNNAFCSAYPSRVLGIVAMLVISAAFVAVAEQSPDKAVMLLKENETRAEGIKALNSMGLESEKALNATAFNRKEDVAVRKISILLLGKIRAVQSRPSIEKCLETEEDEGMRVVSAAALGDLSDPSSMPNLKKSISQDKSRKVRMTAAWAMAKMGDASGESLAIESIKDTTDISGHPRAVTVLEELAVHGHAEVIPILMNCESSSDGFMVTMAKIALSRIKAERLQGESRLQFMEHILQTETIHEVQQWASNQLGISYVSGDKHALMVLKKISNSNAPGAHAASKQLLILISEGKVTKEALGQ